jgi:two-component system OmpR family response regulator
MIQKHILVVDDDRLIRRGLARLLTDNDLRVTEAGNGAEMQRALDTAAFDLVLLDVMLPGDSGFALCGALREKGYPPVILLTARDSGADKLIGFGAGADDYVVKPFDPAELLARIKAVLRRAAALPPAPSAPGYCFDGWRFDSVRRELLAPDNVRIELSTAEFDILLVFLEHPRQVLDREQLLRQARGRSANLYDRGVDVLVSRIRRKIEPDPHQPRIIKTVRGGGYLFALAVEAWT